MKITINKPRIIGIASVLAAAVILLVGVSVLANDKTTKENIAEGIFIGSVDLSGMNRKQAEEALEDYASTISSSAITFVVEDHEILIPVSELGFSYSWEKTLEKACTFGKSGNIVKRYKENKQIEKEGKILSLDFSFDEKAVRAALQNKCTIYDKKAINAGLKKRADGFQVTEGTKGHGLELEQSLKLTMEYLDKDWQGGNSRIALITADIEPRGAGGELSKVKDLIATATTSYTTSSAARSGNIQRGSAMIDGKVLYPGEEFSTYDMISPVTVENGYFLAPSYALGKVVESPGGGICQISTTLYNAVLKAELNITERSNHSMTVSYVDPAMDAVIAGDYKDFKFVNSTDAPIYIEVVNAGKKLTFNIYGMKTSSTTREIEYQSEIINEMAPTTVVTGSGDNFGKISTTQNAHKGLVAKLWKIVKENGVEVSKTEVNQSKYKMAPKYISVGTVNAPESAAEELAAAIAANDESAIRAVIAKYGKVQNSESAVDGDAASEANTAEEAAAEAVAAEAEKQQLQLTEKVPQIEPKPSAEDKPQATPVPTPTIPPAKQTNVPELQTNTPEQ